MTAAIPSSPNPSGPPADSSSKSQKKGKRKKVAQAAKAGLDSLGQPPKDSLPPTAPIPQGGGKTAMELTRSTTKSAADETSALAALSQKDDEYVYSYKGEFIEWKPKDAKKSVRYAVELEIPLKKKRTEYTQNELALQAKEFAKVWLADVVKRLHAGDCPLSAGHPLHAIFNPDQGYLLFQEKEGVDPTSDSYEDITKKTATIKADSKEAKALSKLIDTCEPETFKEKLAGEEFEALKQDANTKTDQAGDAYPPSNLENKGSSCFINAPFLTLVRNPAITKELRNPKNFVNGAKNPLYIAVTGYLDHQASGNKEKYSLGTLAADLGIDDTQPDDVDSVWHIFGAQLDSSKMAPDSPLRSLFVDKLTISPEAGKSAQTLMQKALGAQSRLNSDSAWKRGSSPKTFSLHVGGRAEYEAKPLSQLTDAQKIQIVNDLIAHNDSKNTELEKLKEAFKEEDDQALFDNPLENAEELAAKVEALKQPELNQLLGKILGLAQLANTTNLADITSASSDDDKLELANELLGDGTIYWNENITKILSQDQRSRIGTERSTTTTKVTTPIEKPLSVKLKSGGKTTQYELMTFSLHEGQPGSGGHYVTFQKRGNEYWRIDDQEPTSTSIDAATFLEKAKTASFCVYGTKEITEGSGAAAKTAGNDEIEGTGKEFGNAKLIVEEGSLRKAGDDYVLVNPTDSTLTRINSQFGEDADPTIKTDLIAQKSKIVKERAAIYKIKTRWRNVIDRDVGQSEEMTHTVGGKAMRVLHVSAGDWTAATTEEERLKTDKAVAKTVEGALKKAIEADIAKVAFPLIVIDGYSPERSYGVMRKAIDEFLASKTTHVHSIREVKIIVTEEQRKTIPALTPVEEIAEPDLPPPEYQLGPNTTLVVDDTASKPARLGVTPAPSLNLAETIRGDLAKLKDGETATFDLTLGDGSPMGENRRPFTFNIAHFGLGNYQQAAAIFEKELQAFATENTGDGAKKVKITLKIPTGTTVNISRSPKVGDVPDASTETPDAPPPANITKQAQKQFLHALKGKSASPIQVPLSGYTVTVTPIMTSKKLRLTDHPFVQTSNESDLITPLRTANEDRDLSEIIIDCRPGCRAGTGIVPLDMRHFASDPEEQAQRITNFLNGAIQTANIRKPIKVILPQGTPLPETTKALYSMMEAWTPTFLSSPRISSTPHVPVVTATA
jgi:hypothetical protein